jgi:hypothetical protein
MCNILHISKEFIMFQDLKSMITGLANFAFSCYEIVLYLQLTFSIKIYKSSYLLVLQDESYTTVS